MVRTFTGGAFLAQARSVERGFCATLIRATRRLLSGANVYPVQSTEISSAAVIAAANSARLGSGESTHGGERNIFA